MPELARLALQFAQHMRALGDTTDVKLDAAAFHRDGFGADPAFRTLVAEAPEAIVGYLLYHFGYDSDSASRVVFVADLYVSRPARRLGIATALIDEVRHAARARGARQIVWTVDRRNAAAKVFYRRIGAVVVDLELMCLDA